MRVELGLQGREPRAVPARVEADPVVALDDVRAHADRARGAEPALGRGARLLDGELPQRVGPGGRQIHTHLELAAVDAVGEVLDRCRPVRLGAELLERDGPERVALGELALLAQRVDVVAHHRVAGPRAVQAAQVGEEPGLVSPAGLLEQLRDERVRRRRLRAAAALQLQAGAQGRPLRRPPADRCQRRCVRVRLERRLADQAGRCVRVVLERVRELVRHQRVPERRAGLVLARREGDVPADGERARPHPCGRPGRRRVRVDAHGVEITAEPGADARPLRTVERPARPELGHRPRHGLRRRFAAGRGRHAGFGLGRDVSQLARQQPCRHTRLQRGGERRDVGLRGRGGGGVGCEPANRRLGGRRVTLPVDADPMLDPRTRLRPEGGQRERHLGRFEQRRLERLEELALAHLRGGGRRLIVDEQRGRGVRGGLRLAQQPRHCGVPRGAL